MGGLGGRERHRALHDRDVKNLVQRRKCRADVIGARPVARLDEAGREQGRGAGRELRCQVQCVVPHAHVGGRLHLLHRGVGDRRVHHPRGAADVLHGALFGAWRERQQ